MATRADFTDTDLSAWLDGEGTAEQRERVEAHLRQDAEAAAKVRLWRADRDALRARFDPTRGEPAPQRLIDSVHNGSRWSGAWARAAMTAGLLVAGGVIGSALTWQWQGQRTQRLVLAAQAGTPAGWVQRAAYAHSVFTIEPRHPVEVRAQEEHLSRWLTRRIDVPVKLFDLREHGFELVGGRLLPDGAGKSAQLMYQDAAGTRITVYLRKPDVPTDAAFRYDRQGELGVFYWVESGAGYALVGALPKDRLLALAEAIYRQHPMAAGGASMPR